MSNRPTLRHKASPTGLRLRFESPTNILAEATTPEGIDLYAVERALTGEYPPVALTTAEAHLAWSLIKDPIGELSAADIATTLGVHERTVVRWRMGHTRSGS